MSSKFVLFFSTWHYKVFKAVSQRIQEKLKSRCVTKSKLLNISNRQGHFPRQNGFKLILKSFFNSYFSVDGELMRSMVSQSQ